MVSTYELERSFKKNRNYNKITTDNQREIAEIFGTHHEERKQGEFKTHKTY